MSKGCLVFAFNNGMFDYVRLANSCSIRISEYLDLPTTVVTNETIKFDHNFDKVIILPEPSNNARFFHDTKEVGKWINFNRCDAYSITPYDETILLDADYVVNSTQLNLLFTVNKSILYHGHSYDITGNTTFDVANRFGVFGFPMSWATVVYFKKDNYTTNFFKIMQMVQENYQHYANVYNFSAFPYRNDYALSITDSICNGHFLTKENHILWDLAAVIPTDKVECVDKNSYDVAYSTSVNGKQLLHKIHVANMDLHIMGKTDLEKIYDF